MDRAVVFDGETPQTTDILQTNKTNLIGWGFAFQALLGTGVVVNGLTCTQTSPLASTSVTISSGSIYKQDTVDATAYGDLGVDENTIVKQGILYNALTLTPSFTGSAGQSQVFLVEATFVDTDTGSEVIQYYNGSNPSSPLWGSNLAATEALGTPQNTIRASHCTVQLKAGTPATTGSQATPAADSGYVGLFTITLAFGYTSITNANIAQLATAPYFPNLPAIPGDVQSSAWTYAVDTSAGGPATATTSTTATSSAVLNFGANNVPAWIATGMHAFDLTTVSAITGSQTVLSFTTSTVTLTGNVNATVQIGDLIAFSKDALVASVSPAPAALVAGLMVHIKVAGTNVKVPSLNLNSLGVANINRATGAGLSPGDLTAGEVACLVYDGVEWQLVDYPNTFATTQTNTFSTLPVSYAIDTGTVNNIVVSANCNTPAGLGVNVPPGPISLLFTGLTMVVQVANTNTDVTTITINNLPPANIVTENGGNPLAWASMSAGESIVLVYDGANFRKSPRKDKYFAYDVSEAPPLWPPIWWPRRFWHFDDVGDDDDHRFPKWPVLPASITTPATPNTLPGLLPLAIGDQVNINFENVVEVPLNVATQPGIYEVEVHIFSSNTTCCDFWHQPNDTTFPYLIPGRNAVSPLQSFFPLRSAPGQFFPAIVGPIGGYGPFQCHAHCDFDDDHHNFSEEHFGNICYPDVCFGRFPCFTQGADGSPNGQPPFFFKETILTFPECKHIHIHGGCRGGPFHHHGKWVDVTTIWYSLGTLVFALERGNNFCPPRRGPKVATVTGVAAIQRLA